MSGHSKWSQIKRQKKATDQKKGQLFSKLSKALTIAVKQGGGITDPDKNLRLRLVIDKAKQANMPKDSIMRAIERAKGRQAEELKEIIYGGYGPDNIALLIEAATDNHVRCMQQIKQVLREYGGHLAKPEAVSYLFERQGVVVIDKNSLTNDEIFERVSQTQAADFDIGEKEVMIYTQPDKLHEVRSQLKDLGLKILDCEITYNPKNTVQVTDKEKVKKVLELMDRLDDLEDVHQVHANFDIVT